MHQSARADEAGLRHGLSGRQEMALRRYDAYITSSGWQKTRRRWLWVERRGNRGHVVCAVCGCEWGTVAAGGELHHLSYDRLGAERHSDLVALCRTCHCDVESLYHDGGYARIARTRELGMLATIAGLRRSRGPLLP